MFRVLITAICLFTGAARANEIKYARGFSLERKPGYALIRVADPWMTGTGGFEYALYPKGGPEPAGLGAGVLAVAVPLSRVALTSSTQAAFFAMLGLEGSVAGMACGYLVNTPSLARRYKDGTLPEISSGPEMSGGLDLEKLAQIKPDLVMCYPLGGPDAEIQPKLAEAGFKTVLNTEYRELSPLGRAEWVKFVAAFFCKDRQAGRIFNRIAGDYLNLAGRARKSAAKPSVFLNTDFRGSWWVPTGDSFMAAYLADAGADYVWKDEPGAQPLALTLEAVYSRAKDADLWLNPGVAENLKDLPAPDARLAGFKAFKNGQVYNYVANVNARGGNDFWEGGVARPDLVLKDLVKIFHPELVPDHHLVWYKKLE